jgi:hypothetical protein
MRSFLNFMEAMGQQIQTVGSVYQDLVKQGADPKLLKAQFKDMIYNILSPQEQRTYSQLPSEKRGLFQLTGFTPDGTLKVLALKRLGERLLQQHQQDREVSKFHAENPNLSKQQAKGIYLDKKGSEETAKFRQQLDAPRFPPISR